MEPFEIEWRSSAEKELRRLDKQLIPRVLEAVGALATDLSDFN